MTSFQRAQYEGGEGNFTVEKHHKYYFNQVIKVNINSVTLVVRFPGMMCWKWHFTSVVFLTKTNNPNMIMKKDSDKSNWLYEQRNDG